MNEATPPQPPQETQPLVVELNSESGEKFARLAAGWQMEPSELARRWCEELTFQHKPGDPVLFIEYTDGKETA